MLRVTTFPALLALLQCVPAQIYREDVHSALPPDCGDVKALFAGDLDGDAVPDLVLANGSLFSFYHDAMVVLRSDGRGRWDATFRTQVAFAIGVGDAEGDGDLDVFFDVGVGVNDGSGAITLTSFVFGYGGPGVVADFTGDGLVDVVHGNRFFRNQGSLLFVEQTATTLPVFGSPLTLTALDADGDGDLDLFASNPGVLPFEALLLNQAGVFSLAPASSLPAGGGGAYSVAAADVDLDGDRDLVLGTLGAPPRLYLNQGNATFVDGSAALGLPALDVRSLAFGDVDGDGDFDLVVGERTGGRLLHNHNGVFTAAPAAFDARGLDTTALLLHDLDGDGDPDLVQGCSDAFGPFVTGAFGIEPKVLWNDGTGAFVDTTRADLPARGEGAFAAAGDLDNDGFVDLVLADGVGHVLRNDGRAGFTDQPQQFPAHGRPLLADLDGDTWIDCVLVAADGRFWTLRNQNGALAAWQGPFQIGGLATAEVMDAALGDFDGDGLLDLIAVTGIFDGIQWPPGVPPVVGADALWRGQPNGAFVDVSAQWFGGATTLRQSVVPGDFDGDGDLDAVVAPGALLRNVGATFVTETFPLVYSWGFTQLAAGDFDGDGDLDLAAGNKCTGFGCAPSGDEPPNVVYWNDGNGSFTTWAEVPASNGTGTRAVALGDVDEDGDLDLLFGNGRQQLPNDHLVLNLGGGQFDGLTRGVQFPRDVEDARQVLLADLDGDGDLDAVACNRGRDAAATPRTKVYRNLTRDLDAPYPARPGRPFRLDVDGAATGAAIWLSLQPANVPLPPFGILGLGPLGLSPFVLLPAPANGDLASIEFPLPNDPGLVGLSIYLQAIVQANPAAPLRLTNTLAATVAGF